MDLNDLKSAARSNLEKLSNRVRRLAPGTIYGSLCASTLWPVISAAGQGDFGAVGALCGVLGSMGGSLVAGRIQAWRDRSEAELATELGEEAKNHPEWREALDKLLEEFDSPRIVQGALSEADKEWFARTLKDELSNLGNLDRYQAMLVGSGSIVSGEQAKGSGERGVVADAIQDSIVIPGNQNIAAKGHIVVVEEGATVVIGEASVTMTAVDRKSALGRYLRHVISHNRYLQLQGIRSGGKLVQIELDRIYIRLRATRLRVVEAEERWLAQEAALAPGEIRRPRQQHSPTMETVTVKVEDAMADYPRLVVLGDPGSGKTTLLRYLSLLYARDLAEGSMLLREKLGLDESGWLPILLPLRQIGAFLSNQRPTDDGTEGHAVLLDFLGRSLKSERIELPADFFDLWLTNGKAVILLDGLDEVADPDLRRRVSRLAENFTQAYPRMPLRRHEQGSGLYRPGPLG